MKWTFIGSLRGSWTLYVGPIVVRVGQGDCGGLQVYNYRRRVRRYQEMARGFDPRTGEFITPMEAWAVLESKPLTEREKPE